MSMQLQNCFDSVGYLLSFYDTVYVLLIDWLIDSLIDWFVTLFVRRREKHALVEYMKEHENLSRQIHMLQSVTVLPYRPVA